jgi:hypothetical protein
MNSRYLDSIEAACRAATRGPWAWYEVHERADLIAIYAGDPPEQSQLMFQIRCADEDEKRARMKDAKFLCRARLDVLVLIAEIRRLRQLVIDLGGKDPLDD